MLTRSWSVYIIDTAAAIATTFPANLHIADITTPIPQSWTAYETVSFTIASTTDVKS